ncbi:hypothetical protein GLOIN_2v1786202 [Rhizophagus irregularis DAOM 181602=DAOM 197198]|nr:hypothetical protein GLOIN_2v1786202 [Rhizophagus irregularis DAOM 181602=DAOM 197198]
MRRKMTIRSKFCILYICLRNKLGDLVFGISLINYTSEFAEAVQEKFSKFKNIEIPKAINYELPVYYLYGGSSSFLRRKILAVLFGYWILILPILSENRGGFCSFLYGIEIGASDFSFLGLTVLFGNKGFRQLVLRICGFLRRNFSGSWTHGNLEWYHIGTLEPPLKERNHFSINGTAFEGI